MLAGLQRLFLTLTRMRSPYCVVVLGFVFRQNLHRRGICGNLSHSLRAQPPRREIGRIELGWGRSNSQHNHSIQPLRPLRRRLNRAIGSVLPGGP